MAARLCFELPFLGGGSLLGRGSFRSRPRGLLHRCFFSGWLFLSGSLFRCRLFSRSLLSCRLLSRGLFLSCGFLRGSFLFCRRFFRRGFFRRRFFCSCHNFFCPPKFSTAERDARVLSSDLFHAAAIVFLKVNLASDAGWISYPTHTTHKRAHYTSKIFQENKFYPKIFRTLSIKDSSEKSASSIVASCSRICRCSFVRVFGVTRVTAANRSPRPRPPRFGMP